MDDDPDQAEGHGDGAPPSVEHIAGLDAFLEQLVAEQRPDQQGLMPQQLPARIVAAQLRLLRADVERAAPRFLRWLERSVAAAPAGQAGRRGRAIAARGRFLRVAAWTVAAASIGVAVDELRHDPRQPAPKALVAGAGRWYDIAAAGELAGGQMKGFAAGGVLGYLINDRGRLHAVSALCTHMGCRLKPMQGRLGLRCLCHDARFDAQGRPLGGLAREPLPPITVRVAGGRVYALGTAEDS